MKKHFLFLLLPAVLALLLSGCKPKTQPCSKDSPAGHTLTHREGLAPTCETPGFAPYDVCTVCGYSTYKALPAGHDLVSYPARAVTCDTEGYDAYVECKRCDYSTFSPIPAGHDLISHEGLAAACETAGYAPYETCSRCDYTTYRALPPSHLTVYHEGMPPTCQSAGYAPYETCERCDYTTYRALPPSHDALERGYCPECGYLHGNDETLTDNGWFLCDVAPGSLLSLTVTRPFSDGNCEVAVTADEERIRAVVTFSRSAFVLPITFTCDGTNASVALGNASVAVPASDAKNGFDRLLGAIASLADCDGFAFLPDWEITHADNGHLRLTFRKTNEIPTTSVTTGKCDVSIPEGSASRETLTVLTERIETVSALLKNGPSATLTAVQGGETVRINTVTVRKTAYVTFSRYLPTDVGYHPLRISYPADENVSILDLLWEWIGDGFDGYPPDGGEFYDLSCLFDSVLTQDGKLLVTLSDGYTLALGGDDASFDAVLTENGKTLGSLTLVPADGKPDGHYFSAASPVALAETLLPVFFTKTEHGVAPLDTFAFSGELGFGAIGSLLSYAPAVDLSFDCESETLFLRLSDDGTRAADLGAFSSLMTVDFANERVRIEKTEYGFFEGKTHVPYETPVVTSRELTFDDFAENPIDEIAYFFHANAEIVSILEDSASKIEENASPSGGSAGTGTQEKEAVTFDFGDLITRADTSSTFRKTIWSLDCDLSPLISSSLDVTLRIEADRADGSLLSVSLSVGGLFALKLVLYPA